MTSRERVLFRQPIKLLDQAATLTFTTMSFGGATSSPRFFITSKTASIDSFVFATVSSTDSPCDPAPGSDGTSDQYPPSSAGWTTMTYSIS